jgi:integrase/recombinase XerD
MKISEAYPLFIAHGRAERGYAKETLLKQEECLRSWIEPHLGQKDIEEIDRTDLLRFRAAMVNKRIGVNRQYSILMALKLFFKFCRTLLKLGCLDPTAEIPLPRRPRPDVQYLSHSEVEQVLAVLPSRNFTGARLRALVILLLNTGLRISEALALNRKPFDQQQPEVDIVGKGGKRRTVFLNEECFRGVSQYLRFRDDEEPALFVTTGFARRLARDDISKYFKAVRLKVGLDKPFTPHILRHTYCTHLLHNGADIRFIKELAGHQDIQTTAKYYLGVDRRALRAVVDRCVNYRKPNAEPADPIHRERT